MLYFKPKQTQMKKLLFFCGFIAVVSTVTAQQKVVYTEYKLKNGLPVRRVSFLQEYKMASKKTLKKSFIISVQYQLQVYYKM